jgi:tRNA pseudouridine38-40 synthase
MQKWVIGVEYDGSGFCGWQRQAHCASVQQKLEQALSYVADEKIELSCAGRTDAAVHACEQVAHFASPADRSLRAWLMGANCRLPRSVRILWVQKIEHGFHARFSAVARSYRYVIQNSAVPSALFHGKVCWEYRSLDAGKMHQAAQLLLGEHDFSAFRAAGCQAKTASRNIESLEVSRRGEFIFIDIRANAFLHHMVRNIAGSLMTIGHGEHDHEWLQNVLQGRDRRRAAKTAAAGGLYFVQAHYPEQFKLPQVERRPLLF